MNGFLVHAICHGNDVPLGLFATRAAALDFVGLVTQVTVDAVHTYLYGGPAADVDYLALIEFRNGQIHRSIEKVREFEAAAA
jgi:hypothetical protein